MKKDIEARKIVMGLIPLFCALFVHFVFITRTSLDIAFQAILFIVIVTVGDLLLDALGKK